MASTTVDSPNASTQLAVPVPTTQFLDGGALYVRFTTTSSELSVQDAEWTVAAPEKLRPPRW